MVTNGITDALLDFDMGIALMRNQLKEAHLKNLGDSTIGIKLEQYQRIIEGIGFGLVLDVPFTGREAKNEHFFVYANRELGLLLNFDTFGGDCVNGGAVQYCWKPHQGYGPAGVASSGSWTDDEQGGYWVGSHDCREAIRHHITKLRKYGSLLNPWPKGHGIVLRLNHYMDTRNYKKVAVERIAMMPKWVQEMINL